MLHHKAETETANTQFGGWNVNSQGTTGMGEYGHGHGHVQAGYGQGRVGGDRPGQQSKELKVRNGLFIIHAILSIATCLSVVIITRYWPLAIISIVGAASSTILTILCVYQSVMGGKHRFIDRVDYEIGYLFSGMVIWALHGGLSIYLLSPSVTCASELTRRVGLPYGRAAACNVLKAGTALSFLHVVFLMGWAMWFIAVVRRVNMRANGLISARDEVRGKWRCSTSKILRRWY